MRRLVRLAELQRELVGLTPDRRIEDRGGPGIVGPGEHIGLAIAGLIAVTIVSLSVAGFMHTYSIEAFSSSVVATGYGTARSLSEFVPVLSGLYLMGLGFIVGDAAAPAALLAIGGCLVIAGALLVDRHRNAPLLPPTTQDAT